MQKLVKTDGNGFITSTQNWPDGKEAPAGYQLKPHLPDMDLLNGERWKLTDNPPYAIEVLPTASELLTAARNAAIASIKSKTGVYILGVYPDYKQRNIALFGTAEEKTACQDFIESAVAKSHAAEAAINAMTDPAIIALYQYSL